MDCKKLATSSFLVALTLFALPAFATEDTAKVDETYTAIAVNMNAGPGPAAGRMTLRVKAWTSDEQRNALLSVLTAKGSEALAQALQKEPEVGNFNFTGTLGYTLRYARAVQEGETRHLILATDRWIANVELRSGSRTMDYPVTIIHLALGPDGKGTGEVLVGAQLSLDPTTHEITLEHWGAQPVKLNSVALQKKK